MDILCAGPVFSLEQHWASHGLDVSLGWKSSIQPDDGEVSVLKLTHRYWNIFSTS